MTGAHSRPATTPCASPCSARTSDWSSTSRSRSIRRRRSRKALQLKPGAVITIAGEPYVDGGIPRLRDATATIRLSRAVGIRGNTTVVVRGFLDAQGDERVFDVGRSAPAFEAAQRLRAVRSERSSRGPAKRVHAT